MVVLQREGQSPIIFFSYQRDKYLFSPSSRTFSRISYPCDTIPSPALSTFQSTKGLSTSSEVKQSLTSYGKNVFDIPVPTFGELFAEHAVAPFFVFQVFCAGLWCMDEYWYYSLFTLFMLIVFECTTVFQVSFSHFFLHCLSNTVADVDVLVVSQRLKTVGEFRSMSIKPYGIMVRREKTWIEVQTDELLPGDLVSIGESLLCRIAPDLS